MIGPLTPLSETGALLRVYSPKVNDGFYASQHPSIPASGFAGLGDWLMEPDRMRPWFGFGTKLTPIGKRLLIGYGVIYALALLCTHWINIQWVPWTMLFPLFSDHFYIWQIFTHPFIHDPHAPIGFILNCLVFYFFAAPIEYAFGPKRFLRLFYFSGAGGAVCGLLMSTIPGFNLPFMGMMPSLLALIIVFGLLNPEATILLMFILPIKAKYLSYGTALVTLLTLLAKANPYGAYHLGGILFGYIYFKGPGTLFTPQFFHFKYLEWKMKQKRAKFKVIQGDKDKNHGGPTYH